METKRNRKLRYSGVTAMRLALVLMLAASSLSHAQRATAFETIVPPSAQSSVAGYTSDAIECLQATANPEGVVTLHWHGNAERARLVMMVSGSEATHTIFINGQPIAQTPIYSEGETCSEGQVFYVDVPAGAVMQGENRIALSDDAQPGDQWSAANVRLEVLGDLQPAAPLGSPSPQATCTPGTSPIINFTNSYDSSSQQAQVQIPASYSGAATPLVIFAHARGRAMEDVLTEFGAAANTKGWLLAGPQMHGRWKPPPYPPSPYDPPGSYAYASLESQYDILGTLAYMTANCNVDKSRVHLVGYSMGGQIAVITAAKYPHIFAAVFDNKGPTDFTTWYSEQVAFYNDPDRDHVVAMREECYVNNYVPAYPSGTPANPFCYQRRSGLNFAGNLIHVPISITHSIPDALVPITHSRRLRDAINVLGPDQPVVVAENNICGGGPPACHNYNPPATEVLNFLATRTLNNLPYTLNISSDESKAYYWLNINQLTGDRWTQVQAAYAPSPNALTVTVSDTQSVQLGFNVGAAPIPGPAGFSQPGLGISAKLYRITIGANPTYIQTYASGYLTVTVPSGQTSLVIVPTYPAYLPLISKTP